MTEPTEPVKPKGPQTITCKQCGETKLAYRGFGRNRVNGVGVYKEICTVCETKQQTTELEAETELRRKEHAAEKQRLQAERAKARQLANPLTVEVKKLENELALTEEKRRLTAELEAKKKIEAKARAEAKTMEEDVEFARRIMARRRLIEFTKRFHPNYQAGWVHRDVCRRLERFLQDVVDQKSPRLMLFLPPRSGKSQLASINFPSWALGHYPWMEIIASSYAVSLPINFSRKVRELLQDPAYKAVFPKTALDKTSASAEAWLTTQGGGFVASGVGTGITGKGYHIGIMDDPVKDSEEADSEVVREKVWDWYSSVLYTRAAPGAGILCIMTRWHDDDVAGRLITQMRSDREAGVAEEEIDQWQIIQYPAIATHDEYVNADGTITDIPKEEKSLLVRRQGEALHPERFPLERLNKIKRTLQPRHWSALYQQNPVPDDGNYFTRSMFRYNSNPPPIATMRMFAAWDLAIGEKQTNDSTVGTIAGLDYTDQVFVVDVIRFRGNADQIAEAIVTSAIRWRVELVGIEKGQLEQAIGPTLRKMMREKRATFVLSEGDKALVPINDKLSRARPLQGRMQQGMVMFDNSQPWCEKLVEEALRFPAGTYDDQVDSLAWLMRMVMREDPPKPPRRKTATSLQTKLSQLINGQEELTPMAA